VINDFDIARLCGAPVIDSSGDTIGSAGHVFIDSQTQALGWMTIHSDTISTADTFVPLADATWDEHSIQVPYNDSVIAAAPRIDNDGPLRPEDEAALRAYFGTHAPRQSALPGRNP
jgi:hypothetical protein